MGGQVNLGRSMNGNAVKKLSEDDAEHPFHDKHLVVSGKASISTILFLTEKIKQLEKTIHKVAKLKDEYTLLMTVPGIQKILALTIMYETGPIERFRKVGNYASYCRCVGSKKLSNNKKKGEGNRKNGNQYLAWAYVEAANYAIRFDSVIGRFYQRKLAKAHRVVAIKSVAHKLARACYYILRDQVPFDRAKAFGG